MQEHFETHFPDLISKKMFVYTLPHIVTANTMLSLFQNEILNV